MSPDLWHSGADNTCFQGQQTFYTGTLAEVPKSGRPIFWAGIAAVPALVLLARGLSAHAQSACDLRPSDAEADSAIHEQHQLGLRLLLHDPDAPDPVQ